MSGRQKVYYLSIVFLLLLRAITCGNKIENDIVSDYVIVGDSLTGWMLANRLAEDKKNSICLLDVGQDNGTNAGWNAGTETSLMPNLHDGMGWMNKVCEVIRGWMSWGSSSTSFVIHYCTSCEEAENRETKESQEREPKSAPGHVWKPEDPQTLGSFSYVYEDFGERDYCQSNLQVFQHVRMKEVVIEKINSKLTATGVLYESDGKLYRASATKGVILVSVGHVRRHQTSKWFEMSQNAILKESELQLTNDYCRLEDKRVLFVVPMKWSQEDPRTVLTNYSNDTTRHPLVKGNYPIERPNVELLQALGVYTVDLSCSTSDSESTCSIVIEGSHPDLKNECENIEEAEPFSVDDSPMLAAVKAFQMRSSMKLEEPVAETDTSSGFSSRSTPISKEAPTSEKKLPADMNQEDEFAPLTISKAKSASKVTPRSSRNTRLSKNRSEHSSMGSMMDETRSTMRSTTRSKLNELRTRRSTREPRLSKMGLKTHEHRSTRISRMRVSRTSEIQEPRVVRSRMRESRSSEIQEPRMVRSRMRESRSSEIQEPRVVRSRLRESRPLEVQESRSTRRSKVRESRLSQAQEPRSARSRMHESRPSEDQEPRSTRRAQVHKSRSLEIQKPQSTRSSKMHETRSRSMPREPHTVKSMRHDSPTKSNKPKHTNKLMKEGTRSLKKQTKHSTSIKSQKPKSSSTLKTDRRTSVSKTKSTKPQTLSRARNI